MRIAFTQDRANLVLIEEGIDDYKSISGFPAFTKIGVSTTIPAILPVAYNVVNRVLASFKKVRVDPEVQAWLSQDFKLKPLPESFNFHTSPKDFQEISLRFLYTLGSAGLLLDPGMGKSKVVLDYIHLMGFQKVAIVCPKALLFVWEDEIAKHRPELNFYTLKSTDWDQEKAGVLAAQVVILNYNKAVTLKHRLKEVAFEFLHVDEFLIKAHSTQRTLAITEWSKKVPFRCGGSGTLINNTPLDAFAPIRYLQPALVGGNFHNFENRYTVKKESKDRTTGKSRKIIVNFKGQNEVRSMLESCCIVMTKEHWLKLPEKHFHDIYVQMGEEQKAAYYQLAHNYYLNIASKDVVVDNPLVMLSKLYQISNGFLYLSEESEGDALSWLLPVSEESGVKPAKKKPGKREIHFFPDNPKISSLRKLLTETIPSRKALIWFNLEGEYLLIKDLLDELGRPFLTIRGGEKDVGGKVREFNKNPEIPWLLCQSKSVNYGITVMGSRVEDLEAEGLTVLPDVDTSVYTEVFFSLNFSLEVFLQQQDRIHRLGQEHDCDYYRLFTNSPVEMKIRQAISDKMSIKEEMLVDVAETVLKSKIL